MGGGTDAIGVGRRCTCTCKAESFEGGREGGLELKVGKSQKHPHAQQGSPQPEIRA